MTSKAVQHAEQLLVVCMTFLSIAGQCGFASAVDNGQASSRIASAEAVVRSAFAAVFDASLTDANISVLMARLNAAIDLLTESKHAFSIGDFDNASSLADQCLSSVAGIVGDAVDLKSDAESDRSAGLILSVELASVGVSVLFFAALFVWRVLKKRYFAYISDLRPTAVAS